MHFFSKIRQVILKLGHSFARLPFMSLNFMMLFQASVIEEFPNDALDSTLDSDDMEDDIDKEVDRVLNF